MNQLTKPAQRNRSLAGVLSLIYVALFALAGYLESARIDDYWPTWALWAAGVIWFAIMLVLPFLVLQYFFGLDLSPLWRLSPRKMLFYVLFIGVLIWCFTQDMLPFLLPAIGLFWIAEGARQFLSTFRKGRQAAVGKSGSSESPATSTANPL